MKIEVSKPTPVQIAELGVRNWPIWDKEASVFDWHYDSRETCFILEGQVEVTSLEETVRFGAGDFVVFPKGLSCKWKIIEPVKKHYNFD